MTIGIIYIPNVHHKTEELFLLPGIFKMVPLILFEFDLIFFFFFFESSVEINCLTYWHDC